MSNEPRRFTAIAVDWSGAKSRAAQRRHIWMATIRHGRPGMVLANGMIRDEVSAAVAAIDGPVVVGFDFSFGVPAWFARELGCATIDDVWATAREKGEEWLTPASPFWRTKCNVAPSQRFRRCEERLRGAGLPAKSVFQLVGNGQVGAGSVRGMPLLARLRDEGFAIWPFDEPSDRMVVEIYPRACREVPRGTLPPETNASADAFDAAIAANAMWHDRDTFAALEAATDPLTRLEGDVWLPRPR